MRWNKEKREAILATIEHYKKALKGKEKVWKNSKCPLCIKYRILDGKMCDKCPNKKIIKLFGIPQRFTMPCERSLSLPAFLYWYKEGRIRRFGKKFILKRMEFWQDALNLTQKQFIKKWR